VDETIYFDEECISNCFHKNTLFYIFDEGLPIISDKDKCSILPNNKNQKYIDCKKNNFVDNIDDNDNILTILINNSYSYLNNIYNLKTYDDVLKFLEIDIKELPLLTQKRILNCIYCAYINYAEFPNKKYIFKVKNILTFVYNLKINSQKIYNKIIKLKNNNKYKENNDIFQYLYYKFNKE
jgi:hypothetical protein